MHTENLLTESVKPYDGIYVIATSDLREFQSGHLSLINLFDRQFRIPALFKGLDAPTQAVGIGIGIGSPTFR